MKTSIKITLIFLAGFFLGGAVTGFIIHRHMPRGPLTLENLDRVLNHLSSKLDLTVEQKENARSMMKDDIPKLDALRRESDGKFEALRDSFNARMRSQLNAEQQKKFDEMLARWRLRENERRSLWGAPCPPPTAIPAGH